jgi:peptide-methionine (S)-S-oxide reductase
MRASAPLWLLLSLALGCATAPGAAELSAGNARATFGGGCFWCMEPPYDALDGVISTTSGFMGGHVENPSYQQVVAGGTGHVEVVQVVYDPEKVTYRELLDVYWRNVDPLDGGGQFCDRGETYRPVIFTHDDDQRAEAAASQQAIEASGRFDAPIVVGIETATTFYAAEDYHQSYYRKNPIRYRIYRGGCGRDRRLNELWGR